MRLGLVAAHESALAPIEGLAAAAHARGWPCRCFLTDSGVKLALSPALQALARSGALQVDVCEHSWHHFAQGEVPEGVNRGSQLQNAQLVGECDRVVVIGGAS